MSDHYGEKTEQPTPRRLEEAIKHGQFARSAEVQTFAVLLAGLVALKFAGTELWRHLVTAEVNLLGHLHQVPLSVDLMQGYAVRGALFAGACIGPLVIVTIIG